MGTHYHLHFEHLPWPVSVLKFNGAINAMRTGDDITAVIQDPGVVGNLCQLLGSRADLHYTVRQTESEYCIEVVKERHCRRK